MGMVDLEYIGDCVRAMEAGKRLSPYFVPRILPNLAAGHIAIEHGLRYSTLVSLAKVDTKWYSQGTKSQLQHCMCYWGPQCWRRSEASAKWGS